MADEQKTVEKRGLLGLKSVLGLKRPSEKVEHEPKTEMVTVREEKKHIRRVVKARPMTRKHLSEALEAPKVTEEEIKITEQVIKSIAPVTPPALKRSDVSTFECVQCGANVPADADRCPVCHVLYVRGIADEDVDKLESAAESLEAEDEKVVDEEDIPVVHFNPESGVISYLEKDDRDPEFVMECSYCGTIVEFDTDRCPICGKKFDTSDTGLVSLFTDMEIDPECTGEIDCPFCGERVVPMDGVCPACGEEVHPSNPKDPSMKVSPVIHADNVVFMHLDVGSGEVNYLQRLANRQGYEQLSVQLEGIGRGGFEHENDWKSLSRI